MRFALRLLNLVGGLYLTAFVCGPRIAERYGQGWEFYVSVAVVTFAMMGIDLLICWRLRDRHRRAW